jgi:hypothetical protein
VGDGDLAHGRGHEHVEAQAEDAAYS